MRISILLLDRNDPALGVGDLAPLHPGHGVVQLLGDRADLAVADVSVLALPDQLLDGGHDSSGAGAEHLFQLAFAGSGHDVGDAAKSSDEMLSRRARKSPFP